MRSDIVIRTRRDISGRHATYTFDWITQRANGTAWIESTPVALEGLRFERLGRRAANAINAVLFPARYSVAVPDPAAHELYLHLFGPFRGGRMYHQNGRHSQ